MKTIREFEERLHVEIQTRRDRGLHAPLRRPGSGRRRRLRAPDGSPTTSSARIAATATASPRAATSTGMMKEIYGRARTASARARAARCTSPTSTRACSARTPSSAAGRRSRSVRRIAAETGGNGAGQRRRSAATALQPGHDVRGHEHGRGAEGARDLRVREQRLQRAHRRATTRSARRTSPGVRAAFGMPARACRRHRFLLPCTRRWREAGRARARRGEGPSRIERRCTRFFGHFEGDPQRYRAKDEVRAACARRWTA